MSSGMHREGSLAADSAVGGPAVPGGSLPLRKRLLAGLKQNGWLSTSSPSPSSTLQPPSTPAQENPQAAVTAPPSSVPTHVAPECPECQALRRADAPSSSITACATCSRKFKKRPFCPYCLCVYSEDEDFANRSLWLPCFDCKRWVHKACEHKHGQSGASAQPYICPACCPGPEKAVIVRETSCPADFPGPPRKKARVTGDRRPREKFLHAAAAAKQTGSEPSGAQRDEPKPTGAAGKPPPSGWRPKLTTADVLAPVPLSSVERAAAARAAALAAANAAGAARAAAVEKANVAAKAAAGARAALEAAARAARAEREARRAAKAEVRARAEAMQKERGWVPKGERPVVSGADKLVRSAVHEKEAEKARDGSIFSGRDAADAHGEDKAVEQRDPAVQATVGEAGKVPKEAKLADDRRKCAAEEPDQHSLEEVSHKVRFLEEKQKEGVEGLGSGERRGKDVLPNWREKRKEGNEVYRAQLHHRLPPLPRQSGPQHASTAADDEALARQLHREINSSPRILGGVPLRPRRSLRPGGRPGEAQLKLGNRPEDAVLWEGRPREAPVGVRGLKKPLRDFRKAEVGHGKASKAEPIRVAVGSSITAETTKVPDPPVEAAAVLESLGEVSRGSSDRGCSPQVPVEPLILDGPLSAEVRRKRSSLEARDEHASPGSRREAAVEVKARQPLLVNGVVGSLCDVIAVEEIGRQQEGNASGQPSKQAKVESNEVVAVEFDVKNPYAKQLDCNDAGTAVHEDPVSVAVDKEFKMSHVPTGKLTPRFPKPPQACNGLKAALLMSARPVGRHDRTDPLRA